MGAILAEWAGLLGVVAVALFAARPLAVLACTLGADLSWRERGLLAWVAPRGIVAAAISALFGIKLEAAGLAQAELLVPLAFSLIVGTVFVQSLTAKPLAKLLRVAEPEARGILVVGANPVALAIAKALKENGVRTLVADNTWDQVREAANAGLRTFFGSPVSEHADRRLDLVGLGMLLALSRRPALNALACVKYRAEFGSANVYTVRHDPKGMDDESGTAALEVRGHLLFDEEMTLERLAVELRGGAEIQVVELTEEFGFEDLVERVADERLLLFAIAPDGVVHPVSEERPLKPARDWRVAYLAGTAKGEDKPEAEGEARPASGHAQEPSGQPS